MLVKKHVMVAVCSLALSSGAVFAAPGDTHYDQVLFTVSAIVPSSEFYAKAENDWHLIDQKLAYREGILQPITDKRIEMKSTHGAIRAKLGYAAELLPSSSSGTPIPLTISLDGQALTPTTPVEVYPASNAGRVVFTPLRIATTNTTFQPGNYSGNVSMLFEGTEP
jgi:hypothetical protein